MAEKMDPTITEARCKDGVLRVGDMITEAKGYAVLVVGFYLPSGGSRKPELKAKLHYRNRYDLSLPMQSDVDGFTYQAVRLLSCVPAVAAARPAEVSL